jgi:large subunit ribosomal protein L21
MSYAIVETGGKQIRVEPGRFYDIELLAAEPEADYSINRVLLVSHEGEVTVGQPFIEGAVVEGTILKHWRGRKVIVYKMQPKKKTRKKRGHRQEQTRLMVNAIKVDGSVIAGTTAAAPVNATPATAAEEE